MRRNVISIRRTDSRLSFVLKDVGKQMKREDVGGHVCMIVLQKTISELNGRLSLLQGKLVGANEFDDKMTEENANLRERIRELMAENDELRILEGQKKKQQLEVGKSEVTFRVTFENFREISISFSEHQSLVDLQWRLIYEKQVKNDNGEESGFSGIFLMARSVLDEREWKCQVDFNVKLVAQKKGVKEMTFHRIHEFTSDEYAFGCMSFISLNKLLNPSFGFIQNDSINFEITIRAGEVEFIERDKKKPRVYLKANKDVIANEKHELSFKTNDWIERLYPVFRAQIYVGKSLVDGTIGDFRHFENVEFQSPCEMRADNGDLIPLCGLFIIE